MLLINQVDIRDYGGILLANYTVTGSAITPSYSKSKEGSSFLSLGQQIDLKTITLSFDLKGKDRHDVLYKKSILDSHASNGKVELFLPDGFYYSSVLKTASTLMWVMPEKATVSYTFSGIQHDPEKQGVSTGKFYCDSTFPHTDCRLEVAVGEDSETYNFCGIPFYNAQKGEVFTIDGINKRILVNGAPGALRCGIIEFPYLVPGWNTLTAPDPIKVRYSPTYI